MPILCRFAERWQSITARQRPRVTKGPPEHWDCSMGRGSASPGNEVPQAWQYLRELKPGDVEAQSNLASVYARVLGGPKDWERAVSWWRGAATQGETDARFQLGDAYRTGRGVEQDDAVSVRWFLLGHRQATRLRKTSSDQHAPKVVTFLKTGQKP